MMKVIQATAAPALPMVPVSAKIRPNLWYFVVSVNLKQGKAGKNQIMLYCRSSAISESLGCFQRIVYVAKESAKSR
jgi:hypothetical protein